MKAQSEIAYVVGFRFDQWRKRVALIRKNKPAWQAGLLNGVGGKIEADESGYAAMIREFKEETGANEVQWSHFHSMRGEDWRVEFFAGVGDLSKLISAEAEQVEIHAVNAIHEVRCVENLPWLIPMALDHLEDKRPLFSESYYDDESRNAVAVRNAAIAQEAETMREALKRDGYVQDYVNHVLTWVRKEGK